MALVAYRLWPRSGFHFGRSGHEFESSGESFSSDSLFAALASVYGQVFGPVAEFVQPWLDFDPPFLLSSVFPCVGDLPLFPMPRLRVVFGTEFSPSAQKTLKKIHYVSPAILDQLLSGGPVDAAWTDAGPALALQGGAVWLDESEHQLLPSAMQRLTVEALRGVVVWKTDAVPRVSVDRITQKSNLYFFGRTLFNEGCGLWFLASLRRGRKELDALLDELSVRGIGGERNAGYGAFDLDARFTVPALPQAENGKRLLTLSRYHPRLGELEAGVLGPEAAYELVNVAGWLASPGSAAQRRKQVRMVEVGSVLQGVQDARFLGQLVDVSPSYDLPGAPTHPVYRAGFALTVAVKGS